MGVCQYDYRNLDPKLTYKKPIFKVYCPSLLNLEHLSLPTHKLATDGKINFGPDKKKHDYINVFNDYGFPFLSGF